VYVAYSSCCYICVLILPFFILIVARQHTRSTLLSEKFLLDSPKKNEQSFSSTLLHCNDDEKNNIRSKVNRFFLSLFLSLLFHIHTHSFCMRLQKVNFSWESKELQKKYFLYVDIWEIKSKWWDMGLDMN